MNNFFSRLSKAEKRDRSYFKFALSGIAIMFVGIAVAILGNYLGGTLGTIILLAGLLITAVGATIASPFGW